MTDNLMSARITIGQHLTDTVVHPPSQYNWAGEKLFPYWFSENDFEELARCAMKGGWKQRHDATFAAPPQIDNEV